MYTYTYMGTYTHTEIYVHICIYTHVYIHIYTERNIGIYISLSIYPYLYNIESSPRTHFGLFCADPLITYFSIILKKFPLLLDAPLSCSFLFSRFRFAFLKAQLATQDHLPLC